MKKEYLDYLYELRSLVQADIDRLSMLKKTNSKDPDKNAILAELRTRRSQIGSINETIEKYLELHK